MSDAGSTDSARNLHRERWNRSSPGLLDWGASYPPSRDPSRSASQDSARQREDGHGLQRRVSPGRYRDFWLHNGDVDPRDGGRKQEIPKVQVHQTGRPRDFWLHAPNGDDSSDRGSCSPRSQSLGRGREAYRLHMSETQIPWANGQDKVSRRPRSHHADRDRYTVAMPKSSMPFGTLEPSWDRLNARRAAPPPRSGARAAPRKLVTPTRSRSNSSDRSLDGYLAPPRSNKAQEAFLKGRDENTAQLDSSTSGEANSVSPADKTNEISIAQQEIASNAIQVSPSVQANNAISQQSEASFDTVCAPGVSGNMPARGHTFPRPRETSSTVIGSWSGFSPRGSRRETSSSVMGSGSPRQETSSSVIGAGISVVEARNGSAPLDLQMSPRSDSDTIVSSTRPTDRFNPQRRCMPPTCHNLYHKQMTGKTTIQELFDEEQKAIEENTDRSTGRSQSAEPIRSSSPRFTKTKKKHPDRYQEHFGGSEIWELQRDLPAVGDSEKRAVSAQPRIHTAGYRSQMADTPIWAWSSVGPQDVRVQEPATNDLKSQLFGLCEQGSSLAKSRDATAYTSHPAMPKCVPAVSSEGRAAGLPVELGRTVEMAEFVLHSAPTKNARQHLHFEHLRTIEPPLRLAPLTLPAK